MKNMKIVLEVLAAGTLLYGCKSSDTSTFQPAQSSIFVARDGGISSALVEKYDKDYYSESELKAEIEKAVAEYNAEKGADLTSLKSCTMKDGKASAVFTYVSGDAMVDFAETTGDHSMALTSFSTSTVTDLVNQGTISDAAIVDINGKAVSADTLGKETSLHAITMDGSGTVQTQGKIVYMSEGCTLKDSFTVVVPEGNHYIVFK